MTRPLDVPTVTVRAAAAPRLDTTDAGSPVEVYVNEVRLALRSFTEVNRPAALNVSVDPDPWPPKVQPPPVTAVSLARNWDGVTYDPAVAPATNTPVSSAGP